MSSSRACVWEFPSLNIKSDVAHVLGKTGESEWV